MMRSLLVLVLAACTVWADPSPDGTCGNQAAGESRGFTCLADKPCCSPAGYCGAEDAYCLTSVGCQGDFSNATAACKEPISGETISPDGTCGTTGDSQFGYRCAAEDCCSSVGYCGNTTAHCENAGCQPTFGRCEGGADIPIEEGGENPAENP